LRGDMRLVINEVEMLETKHKKLKCLKSKC